MCIYSTITPGHSFHPSAMVSWYKVLERVNFWLCCCEIKNQPWRWTSPVAPVGNFFRCSVEQPVPWEGTQPSRGSASATRKCEGPSHKLLMAVPGLAAAHVHRQPGWPDISPPEPHQTQRAWEGPSLLCVVSPEAFGDTLVGRLLVLIERILCLGTGESRFKAFHSHLLHAGQVTWISPVLRRFPKLARVLRLRLCTDVKVS